MFKTVGKVVVVCLVVVGALNFYSLNKPAFKGITTTITKEPASEIPGKVLTTVTHHNWKFRSKS